MFVDPEGICGHVWAEHGGSKDKGEEPGGGNHQVHIAIALHKMPAICDYSYSVLFNNIHHLKGKNTE